MPSTTLLLSSQSLNVDQFIARKTAEFHPRDKFSNYVNSKFIKLRRNQNMPSTTKVLSSQSPNVDQFVARKTAEFHPQVWGDKFSNYVAEPKELTNQKKHRIEELKEELRREIVITTINPSLQLKLIGDIQRLGLGYHFEKEIEEALAHIYEAYHDDEKVNNLDDLYDVSLLFRLLRQQGLNISCDIFNKFKDKNGNFSEVLVDDKLGILGLYEAAHMRKHGEDVLDEALLFATTQLTETCSESLRNPALMSQVKHALIHPIRKNMPRLEARYYMSIYDQIDSYYKPLLELGKLDFNLVQSLHKEELSDLTRWWNDLNFTRKLPYGRDRIVELYCGTVGVYFEPQYLYGRKVLTKVAAMVSYIDDMFDSYGTLQELELFTNAIERWDYNGMDQLPKYLQILYKATLDVYKEIEEEMARKGRSYYAHYAKETMKRLVNVLYQEAKWCNEDYVPTLDEYISIGIVSSVYPLFGLTSLLGVEQLEPRESLEWLFSIPTVLRATSTIFRLLNDIATHKREKGHDVSAVECSMKGYGVTEQQAYEMLRECLINEWKNINEECLKLTTHRHIVKLLLNLARNAEVFYTEGDGYTHAGKEMRARIASLLIDPITI